MRHRLRVLGASFALVLPSYAHEESTARMAELDTLIAAMPDQPILRVRRADFHTEHGAWAAAEADLREATRLDHRLPELAPSLARFHFGTGRFGEARRQLDRALDAQPNNAELLVLRARATSRLGDPQTARFDYDRAIALISSPPPELFLERAALPLPADRLLTGIDEGLATVGPVIALLERALQLELELGRFDAALARIDAMTASMENKAPWIRRRGDILLAAGREEEARDAYAAALAELHRLPAWLQASPDSLRLAAELTPLIPPLIQVSHP
jgi:predicted Zn-dependent protease